ncbi:uncharacterized protein C18orf63 homolog isoform X3 [Dendrobates tinctorius]|uniref:uncharacterized protein C18orf63 homolog isoform X3 n=1 Tax=Dendrobates tinctorius TaxID=92724 RepID=UPI003CC94C6E
MDLASLCHRTISFYEAGKLQALADKQQFTMERPERVTPAMLQSCLFYTITVRLTPYWNKAGHILIQGADFLTKSGKQDAVAISINVLDNQLFITVQVHAIRLLPCQLCDFDVGSECFESSLTWNSSFIRKKSSSSNWCYVLPSMKMGRLVHLSHDIPPECPFKSYVDFQNYWKTLYGYELPHMSESDVIYCSVYFKFIGETIFTYPFICLRSQPIQFFPRVDLTRVTNTFVDDLKSKMPHLCGFPVNMTKTPFYPVKELSRPLIQGNNFLTNLTASMKLTMTPKTSEQTEIIQKEIPLKQPLACSEKHPPVSLYVQHFSSDKVSLESQCSNTYPTICSTHSGNGQKYVPFFHGKTGRIKQNDVKNAEGNKASAVSNITDIYNTFNFSVKDVMPAMLQISDAKRKTPCNVLHKSIQMKSNKEVFANTGLICSSNFSEKQSCFSVSIAPEKDKIGFNAKNSEPSQSEVFDSYKLNYTSDIVDNISHKRKEDHNVNKTSNNQIAASQLKEEKIQKENLVLPPKKYKTSRTVKKMDVEQQARENKLFKVNNSDLQDWLKRHGISTRTRDKKEQLVAKIMQFIQQS